MTLSPFLTEGVDTVTRVRKAAGRGGNGRRNVHGTKVGAGWRMRSEASMGDGVVKRRGFGVKA